MALIYCGIDEAGYGPMLGPLCVGFSAFRIETWAPEEGAPDLWKTLERAVCRKGRDAKGRIAVADSKKLKLSNQSKTRHPLTHLERGVLAFGGLVGGSSGATGRSPVPNGPTPTATSETPHWSLTSGTRESPGPDNDAALFTALGVRLEPHPWYAGDPVVLPLAGSAAQLAIARNRLALACEAAGVEPIALACISVGETEFNEAIRTGGNKAHLTTRCFARFLRRAVERWGGGEDEVRIVCDRHGGRTSYAPMIEAVVRGLGFEVETLEESERCSRYAVQKTEPEAQARSPESARQSQEKSPPRKRGDTRRGEEAGIPDPSLARGAPFPDSSASIHVQFRPEAEEAHLPVALASMTAKLVRELVMGRFNRYWSGRMPELKPTAGYVQDARRWLEDLEGVLCDDERDVIIRRA